MTTPILLGGFGVGAAAAVSTTASTATSATATSAVKRPTFLAFINPPPPAAVPATTRFDWPRWPIAAILYFGGSERGRVTHLQPAAKIRSRDARGVRSS